MSGHAVTGQRRRGSYDGVTVSGSPSSAELGGPTSSKPVPSPSTGSQTSRAGRYILGQRCPVLWTSAWSPGRSVVGEETPAEWMLGAETQDSRPEGFGGVRTLR